MAASSRKHASARLTEIIGVLQKHHILHGLTPVRLREILEDLGPTYVKFGQIMSMRSDMLPREYTKELEKLRTDVLPMDYDTVIKTIRDEMTEPIDDVFESIDSEPLGSASIAQVHQAVLKTGEHVVIKVQRPLIYETMEADIRLLRQACRILKVAAGTGDLVDFRAVIEELWKTTQFELDFIKEADNMDRFLALNQDVNYVTVPGVYREWTTRRMLVMDDVGRVQINDTRTLKELGYDVHEIAMKAAENYVKQLLDDGFFHADPHPGNIHVMNRKIAFIDFGMMGTLTPSTRQILAKGVQAVLDDDIYDLQDAFLMLVKPSQQIDEARLIRQLNAIVEQYKTRNFKDFDFAPLIEGCFEIIKSNQIAIPADLTMMTRSMVTMEGTLGQVSDEINLITILANHMRVRMQENFDTQTQILHYLHSLYTFAKKSVDIPSVAFDNMKLLKNGHLLVNVHHHHSHTEMVEKRTHVKNIILCALIGILYLTAALVLQSDLPDVMWHLPLPSLIGFFTGTVLFIRLLWRLRE